MISEDNKLTLVFSYEGPFNMRIISSLGKYLAEYLETGFETRMSLYRVFIEICQNVALYSINRINQDNNSTVGIGKVLIESDQNYYYCTTQNAIQDDHAKILKNYCEEINSLETNDLIKFKEKLRRESSIRDNGAHIGLISIRLFSKNKLKIVFDKINNQSVFIITSLIEK